MSASNRVVSVIGLGYVGLPVAVAFGRKFRTIGFDINPYRVNQLRQGRDETNEVTPAELAEARIEFTSQPEDLRQADFHIIAVPTPVDAANQPDFLPLIRASETVGRQLQRGAIVVYESTVYPGATEEECVPVLEKFSGLKAGVDFKVGYSPERINPGDKQHSFEKIKKVVSAMDEESLGIVADTYGAVVTAGVYRAASIKVAEAAKVIENTQRDLNIALMNELSVLFDRLQISTRDVLDAAGTKWNFLPFRPGLVGGHCIGVDPYYLTHKAEKTGYIPQVILAGRRINDSMSSFVALKAIKELALHGATINQSVVTVLGATFKENCKDIRNSKVFPLIRDLQEFGVRVQLHDPLADAHLVHEEYGMKLTPWSELVPAPVVIVAVAHDDYKKLKPEQLAELAARPGSIFDLKAAFEPAAITRGSGLRYWSL